MNAYTYDQELPVRPFQDVDAERALSLRAVVARAMGLAGGAAAMLLVVAHALHATA